MVKKKVDERVRGLIVDGVRNNHRSLFVLVGDHGKDQVENLHKILSRCRIKARPSVLWCYKKELGFSSHKKKRMKEIKRDKNRGLYDPERDDPFELFISSTNIRWTYYKETDKILGQTFGMCVLQDFEAITPNLLARTIETVEGGGLVVILMKTVKSLKQLYAMTMDVHSRFRTEAHHEIVPRFNERFILSLSECRRCLVLDDELNILPISSTVASLPVYGGEGLEGLEEGTDLAQAGDPALAELKASLSDTPMAGSLVEQTRTTDQANAVLSFLDAISQKTLRATVSLTAGRGRGKSAAIGLCLAGAIGCGYSNIFVTAPSPENLKTVFEFVLQGLRALKYAEHIDFEIVQEFIQDIGKVTVRINVFRTHRQTIQYILPSEHQKLAQAELVAIDEAAAIPLPTVKSLLGPYLVFLSSTINGYEGTGRALSLKLIQQLRVQQGAEMSAAAHKSGDGVAGPRSKKSEHKVHEARWKAAADSMSSGSSGVRSLTELSLSSPIRYGSGDPIESWLNSLLCLDSSSHSTRLLGSLPAPSDCELYMVNRDALFSFHSLSEALLQRIWSLYTSAHYKNSPNDLQMLSDAPAHRLMVLLGPQQPSKSGSGPALPDVLCVVQIAFEGLISKASVQAEIGRGNRASGDLIPWTISQQFNDRDFPSLSGARVVRIATHPDAQNMGYGSRAVELLQAYFKGEISASLIPSPGVFGGEGAPGVERISVLGGGGGGAEADLGEEDVSPRTKLPPLLVPLSDRPAERLHWLGSSFGLTGPLLTFWSRANFHVCYVRQTANDLTGEFSSVVLNEINAGLSDGPTAGWLTSFEKDYQRRLISLLGMSFSKLDLSLAMNLIDPRRQLTSTSNGTSSTGDDEEIVLPTSTASSSDVAPLTASELISVHLSHHDLARLELYSRNMADHHMVLDLVPLIIKLLFQGRMPGIRLSHLQAAISLAVGLQLRDVDSVSSELDLPANQILAFFNKTIRKISSYLHQMVEASIEKKELTARSSLLHVKEKADKMRPSALGLTEEQKQDEKSFKLRQKELVGASLKGPSSAQKPASQELGGKKKKESTIEESEPVEENEEEDAGLVIDPRFKQLLSKGQAPQTISFEKEEQAKGEKEETASNDKKRKPDNGEKSKNHKNKKHAKQGKESHHK